jgi:hypothetical protein
VEGEIGRLVDGLSRDFSVILIIERKHAAQKKVHDDSQTPQVDFLAIGLLEKHLRGDIGLYKLKRQDGKRTKYRCLQVFRRGPS